MSDDTSIRVAVHATADVGEGPVFDERTGLLCWVDITAGHLLQTDLTTQRTERLELGTMVGAAAPRASADGFAVAVAEGFGLVETGVLRILDPVLPDPAFRMNDAKCDPTGRMWAGSTALDFASGQGKLHRWDGRSPSTVVHGGLTLPNGLGWNAEGTIMYLIDSMPGVLMSAPFDVDRGEVGEFQPLATVSEGLPDGLAVAMDGTVWVAIWGAGAVHRYAPDGRLIGSIRVPVRQPSSCAFGPDGTLYVTSARSGMTPEALRADPLAGSVLAVDTDAPGVRVNGFGA